MQYCEADKYRILETIELISNTIIVRLLPTFNIIEEEAKKVEEKKLSELSENFNSEYMDEGCVYEDAYHEGVNHYLMHHEMKKEFLNNTITWLFHIFEKDCDYIFKGLDGNGRKKYLSDLGIEIDNNSLWFKNNKELRLLANAIKHGNGDSARELKKFRPDFFKEECNYLSEINIDVSVDELEKYIHSMKNFWNCFFSKVLLYE